MSMALREKRDLHKPTDRESLMAIHTAITKRIPQLGESEETIKECEGSSQLAHRGKNGLFQTPKSWSPSSHSPNNTENEFWAWRSGENDKDRDGKMPSNLVV